MDAKTVARLVLVGEQCPLGGDACRLRRTCHVCISQLKMSCIELYSEHRNDMVVVGQTMQTTSQQKLGLTTRRHTLFQNARRIYRAKSRCANTSTLEAS